MTENNYTCINTQNYDDEEFNKILENHNKHKKMRKSKFNNLCNNLRKYNNNKNQNNIIDLFNDYEPMYNNLHQKVFDCKDNELLDLDLETCTCGQNHLAHYNIIKNKHNNKKLVIGDSCINFWITNKLIKNKINTIIYNQKNKDEGILKKRCLCCYKKYFYIANIDEFDNKEYCLSCEVKLNKKHLKNKIYNNNNMSVVYTPVKRWSINFGKHKGEFFEDLPISYVKWLVEKEVYLKPAKTDHYNKINQHIHNYLSTRIKESDIILNNLNDNNNDI